MGKVVCPKCEKDDQIQKVTSIVTSGVSTTNYKVENAYGSGSGTSTSQTQLAKRLSPPPKPKGTWSWADWSGCSGMIAIVIFGAVVGGIFQTIAGAMGIYPDTSVLPFVIGFFVPIVGLFLVISSASQQVQKNIPDWEKKISKWNELYYCYRDDCVFDPKTNKHISPESIDRLL